MKKELLHHKNWLCWHEDNRYLTIDDIKFVEQKIQKKFPQAFIKIISHFNGCTPKNGTFKLETFGECGLGKMLSLKNLSIDTPVEFPKGLIPCAELSKDLFLCFDYRNDSTTDDPKVIEWFFDRNSEFLKNYYSPPEFFPQDVIAFGEDGGGNCICFDYRQQSNADNPPIVYWYHEAEPGKNVFLVANTFDEFLDMLYPYSE